MKKIIGLVGTNSDFSTNRQLLQFMEKHFQDKIDMELVEINNLPLFNKPADRKIPEEAQEIADKIVDADGVIISTPEYDQSITAALSSALSWLSYGIYPFVDKPVMITGASYGTLGSSRRPIIFCRVALSTALPAISPTEYLAAIPSSLAGS